jgi:hypothetical protein
MLFSVIVSVIVVAFCLFIDNMVSGIANQMTISYGTEIVKQQHILINSEEPKLLEICPILQEQFLSLESTISYFYIVVLISGLGYLTSIV